MVETDVLVVGGGPAGVISALTAAKMGQRVILVDTKEQKEIGNKVCGDALNLAPADFLEKHLGLEHPNGEEVADTVERLIFKSSNKSFPLEGDGYVLNRHPYGQRLLKKAIEYGVELRANTRAIKAICSESSVIGAVVKEKGLSNEPYEIYAKITIDCSGRHFIIRRTIPQNMFPYLERDLEKRDTAASYREIISLKNEDHPYHNEIYLIYDESIPEPGYFWIFSKGTKQLNLGIGWFMDQKVERGMKELFWEVLHKYYPEGSYEVIDKGGGQIPTRYPLTNAIAPGFITAGDAALHVNPLSAEGHGPALVAGYFAGKTASEAIKSNNYNSEEFLWQYNLSTINHFGVSHTKTQLFSESLKKVKVAGLEFLIRRKILTREQFLSLHSGKNIGLLEMLKIGIRAFPRYKLLLHIYKLSQGAKAFELIFSDYPTNPADYPKWKRKFDEKMSEYRGFI